jgi:lipid II:glycine glycyltransferase (peptidoglycan interpeptide bridge formation enzyme)
VRGNSAATLSRFLKAIESHARGAGDVTFQVGSFASPTSTTVLSSLGFCISRRLEFELDLMADEKTLWDGMEYKRRKNIKKAKRLGVEVRELPVDEGVSHLRRLQAASFVRIVQRGGPALTQLDSDRADPTAVLTNAGVGRIVGGFVDGVCVSASFFTTFNGLAYHTLSGHDGKALETQAPTFLLWAMALRFKGEGIQRLNFGGCRIDALEESSPEHGVYVYKKAFGGAVLECGSGEKILRPAVKRAANLLRAAMR